MTSDRLRSAPEYGAGREREEGGGKKEGGKQPKKKPTNSPPAGSFSAGNISCPPHILHAATAVTMPAKPENGLRDQLVKSIDGSIDVAT